MINNENIKQFETTNKGRLQAEDYRRRLQSIVQQHGGFCMSQYIENQNQKLLLQCANGHQWRASASSIVYSKSWCPICARNHILSIGEMNELARRKGGICISRKYTNSKTKLLWQCADGHQWHATPFSIKTRRSWCPECTRMNEKKN